MHTYFSILDMLFMRRVRCVVCMQGWKKQRVLHARHMDYAPATHSRCCREIALVPGRDGLDA
jgi:hypothetical protein